MTDAVEAITVISTQQACLLDTDVLIDYLRGYPVAQRLFAGLPSDRVVSVVSVAELYGVCVKVINARRSACSSPLLT